jgi:hypothetical protein
MGAAWIESTVAFPTLDHTFAPGRHLGVRIVVSSASESDMIFAYGYASQRSRLTLHSERPAGPLEAATLTPPALAVPPADFAAVPVSGATPPPVAPEPDVTVSAMPWLMTLAISTAGLVVLGSLLLASLERPGRHERLPAGPRPGGQSSRISVPAP